MDTHASTTVAGPVISIEAKPEPITIDIATTAALVVDMQNDFCAKGGMFDRAGNRYFVHAKRRSTNGPCFGVHAEGGNSGHLPQDGLPS
jgi:hypothetical protein